MSIKLNAQSGGSVALDAPTQTTSSADLTFKLPVADGSANQLMKTDGSGNLGWATDQGGKILQVKHAFKKDAYTNSSGNFAAITGLAVTIAAASTSNKLLFQCNLMYSLQSMEIFVARLYDGTSEITDTRSTIASTANNNGWITDYNKTTVSASDLMTNVSGTYLHTPTDTNSHTYNIYVRSHSGSNVYINRRGYADDFGGTSDFSVMEIAA